MIFLESKVVVSCPYIIEAVLRTKHRHASFTWRMYVEQ